MPQPAAQLGSAVRLAAACMTLYKGCGLVADRPTDSAIVAWRSPVGQVGQVRRPGMCKPFVTNDSQSHSCNLQ